MEPPPVDVAEGSRHLVAHLSLGWRAGAAAVAKDYVSRWASSLDAEVEIAETGDGFLSFVSDLGRIRVRGMDAVPCLLVGGHSEELAERVTEFRRKNRLDRLLIIIGTSESAIAIVASRAPKGRCVLLGPALAAAILHHPASLELLKTQLRRQVHRRDLIPFNVEHHASGGMFCGRERYLERLNSDTGSFAIAGPSRLGKTSLLRKYREDLVKSRDSAALSTFYIDLYRVEREADKVARFIALSIDSSSRSGTITGSRLELFCRYWTNHFGRAPTLLLDEVDEVLHLEIFDTLEMIARKDFCRLILAGKAKLLAATLDSNRALAGRLIVMRLDPLTDTESELLFAGALQDVGFTIRDKPQVMETVAALTGKMPHLLQYYGRAVANHLLDSAANVIDVPAIESVRDQFETAAYILSPLVQLPDGNAKTVALAVLSEPSRPRTVQEVHRLASDCGLQIGIDETLRICNDLVLNTILKWDRNHFEVSSGSLGFHARASGLI